MARYVDTISNVPTRTATRRRKPANPAVLTKVTRFGSVDAVRVRYYEGRAMWVDLTAALQSVEWNDVSTQPSREVTITLDNSGGQVSSVRAGGGLLVTYLTDTGWAELFRGTTVEPSPRNSVTDTSMTVRALDPMHNLASSEAKFAFKGGHTATYWIQWLARAFGIPMGYVDDTKVKLGALTHEGSPYEAALLLLKKTREKKGGRFLIDFVDGKLHLFKYTTPKYVAQVTDVISEITRTVNTEESKTVIEVISSSSTTKGTGAGKRKAGKVTRYVARANRDILATRGVLKSIKVAGDATSTVDQIRKAARAAVADASKPVEEVTIEIPGDVVTLRRLMPVEISPRDPISGAGGIYYVTQVQGRLAHDGSNTSVTLKRKPEFPEEPDEVKAVKVGNKPLSAGGAGSPGLTPSGGWGGSEGPAMALARLSGLTITSSKRGTRSTASGGTSDHWVGNTNAYAVDLGWGGSSPTAQADAAASRIVAALGGSASWGSSGGVFNTTLNGLRFQVIYRSNVGGNHFNHIHVGVKKV